MAQTAAQLAQLFQPFNRLGQEANAEEGTGIGLVVCKRLVELMGGQIGASSRVGVGSEFWVDFPASPDLAIIDELALPALLPGPPIAQPEAGRKPLRSAPRAEP